MQNYFNYFTEIEDRFQQRRGSLLMLSTLDWGLIETWREGGVPLEAVLRGIDDAFDRHDAQKLRAGAKRQRKINGLAWAAQSVMQAAEAAVDASTGAPLDAVRTERESGFERDRIREYLLENAGIVEKCGVSGEVADRLRALAGDMPEPEALDRTLTLLEERLFAGLLLATPEEELVSLRAQADRELGPYRGRMQAVQIRQVREQFLQKRLMESRGIPRLSLFYMKHT